MYNAGHHEIDISSFMKPGIRKQHGEVCLVVEEDEQDHCYVVKLIESEAEENIEELSSQLSRMSSGSGPAFSSSQRQDAKQHEEESVPEMNELFDLLEGQPLMLPVVQQSVPQSGQVIVLPDGCQLASFQDEFDKVLDFEDKTRLMKMIFDLQ